MKTCPICRSTRIKRIEGTDNFRCDKCGYEHREDLKYHGKVLRSRSGTMEENWWMR